MSASGCMVRMADRYQMEGIQSDLEEAVMDRLRVECCGRILTMASASGLVRLERASRKLALREFDDFAECEGFMDVSEDVLVDLASTSLVGMEEESMCRDVGRRGGVQIG
jgi:hypothetical protein